MFGIIFYSLWLLLTLAALLSVGRFAEKRQRRWQAKTGRTDLNPFITGPAALWSMRILLLLVSLWSLFSLYLSLATYYHDQNRQVLGWSALNEFLSHADWNFIFILPLLPLLLFVIRNDRYADSGVALFLLANRMSMPLAFVIRGEKVGPIKPGQQKYYNGMSFSYPKYDVVVKTEAGEGVYSREYSHQELNAINWQIVVA